MLFFTHTIWRRPRKLEVSFFKEPWRIDHIAEGNFRKFSQTDDDFLRECYFCNRLAKFKFQVQYKMSGFHAEYPEYPGDEIYAEAPGTPSRQVPYTPHVVNRYVCEQHIHNAKEMIKSLSDVPTESTPAKTDNTNLIPLDMELNS